MPRVLVTAGAGEPTSPPVLLDEAVYPSHLEDDHAAAQLIERIAWAVSDAEEVEKQRPRHMPSRRARGHDARDRR
jgi:hypothetical protein